MRVHCHSYPLTVTADGVGTQRHPLVTLARHVVGWFTITPRHMAQCHLILRRLNIHIEKVSFAGEVSVLADKRNAGRNISRIIWITRHAHWHLTLH